MIGASGAVAAVIAAYAVTYPWARVLTFVPLGFIPLVFPVPAFLFGFVWFGTQLLEGSSELASPAVAASVAWWAHIGGFVFGALVAIIARHSAAADRSPARDPRPRPRAARPNAAWSGAGMAGAPTFPAARCDKRIGRAFDRRSRRALQSEGEAAPPSKAVAGRHVGAGRETMSQGPSVAAHVPSRRRVLRQIAALAVGVSAPSVLRVGARSPPIPIA